MTQIKTWQETTDSRLWCSFITELFYDWVIKNLAGQKILDVGAGDGALAPCLVNVLGKQVTAIDQVPSELLKSYGVEAVAGNATKLPFPENSFDAVTSSLCIHHISNDGDTKAMKEIYRVLKPTGQAFIFVPYWKEFFEKKNFHHYKKELKSGETLRVYDEKALRERVLKSTPLKEVSRIYVIYNKPDCFISNEQNIEDLPKPTVPATKDTDVWSGVGLWLEK